jgi:hypothetical protein
VYGLYLSPHLSDFCNWCGRDSERTPAVAHGLGDDQIAAAMMFSLTTAKTHVSRAMSKLGAGTTLSSSSSLPASLA